MYHGCNDFLSDIMIPLLIFGIVGYGILNRQNIYEEFIDRGKGRLSDGHRNHAHTDRAYGGGRDSAGFRFLECFPGCWDGDRLAGFSAGA